MLNTLYSKLAFSMFVLLLCIGVVVFFVVRFTTSSYEQEVTQRLNVELARHVIDHEPLIADEQVNEPALEKLFHWLMFVNPNLEVYLLDVSGQIIAFSAPQDKIKRKRVSLSAIKIFIERTQTLPIFGDDPRDLMRKKIFSAAPILNSEQRTQGYLYIILASEQYDTIATSIKQNVSLQTSLWWLLLSIFLGLVVGLSVFYLLTSRLRNLSAMMQRYSVSTSGEQLQLPCKALGGDEIDRLARTFNQMSGRIEQQVQKIRDNDKQRRDLVTNISHDLRTPLTSLHGYLETLLIKGDQFSAREYRRYLDLAIIQSSHIQKLIKELFELSRLESCDRPPNLELFSAAELLQDVAQKYEPVAKDKQIQIIQKFEGNPALVHGDIGLIQRAFENLIDNAIKHTPRQGVVQLQVHSDQGRVVVSVANTGPGIPEDELGKVFERFYRSKTNKRGYTGTGLGLSIVKRIVSLHKGAIEVFSQPDDKTTFVLTFSANAGKA